MVPLKGWRGEAKCIKKEVNGQEEEVECASFFYCFFGKVAMVARHTIGGVSQCRVTKGWPI